MPKIAVFASGRGSNFVAIHRYLAAQDPGVTIVCLVTDKPGCGAAEYAVANDIPVINLVYKGLERSAVEAGLIPQLRSLAPDLLVFAGFMRLVTPTLIDAYPRRIVNLHPSLLPQFPGGHAIAESFASSAKELGITIHYVDYGMDTGEIIVQESFFRQGDESLEVIEARIHELEHAAYPAAILAILKSAQTEAVR